MTFEKTQRRKKSKGLLFLGRYDKTQENIDYRAAND